MPLKRRSSLFLGARNTSDAGPLVRENSTNSTASAASSASAASNTDPDTTIIPAANEEDEREDHGQQLQSGDDPLRFLLKRPWGCPAGMPS